MLITSFTVSEFVTVIVTDCKKEMKKMAVSYKKI